MTNTDDPDACWEWTGQNFAPSRKNPERTYPAIYLTLPDGRCRRRQAARVAYEHWIGPIPRGFCVIPTCANWKCINPRHLVAVTRQASQDWTARSRTYERFVPRYRRHGRSPMPWMGGETSIRQAQLTPYDRKRAL